LKSPKNLNFKQNVILFIYIDNNNINKNLLFVHFYKTAMMECFTTNRITFICMILIIFCQTFSTIKAQEENGDNLALKQTERKPQPQSSQIGGLLSGQIVFIQFFFVNFLLRYGGWVG